MGVNFSELKGEQDRLRRSKEGGNSDYLKNFIRMPDGAGYVDVRILPPAPGTSLPTLKGGLVMPTRTHKLGEGGNVNTRNYHCRRELVIDNNGKRRWMANQGDDDCPVCLHYSHLWRQSDQTAGTEKDDLIALARAIKPMERYYFNCIEVGRSDGQVDGDDPKILSVGITIYDVVLLAFLGSEEDGIKALGDITDFKTGRTLRINKQLHGGFADYKRSTFLEPEPFGTPEQHEKWMANLHDLAGLRKVLTYEELKEKLQIHLGVIKPTAGSGTSYNPEDFQLKVSSDVNVEVTPTVEPPAPAQVEETVKVEESVEVVQEKPKEEDKSNYMIEDDFFNELNELDED